jgi:hypothetical protein
VNPREKLLMKKTIHLLATGICGLGITLLGSFPSGAQTNDDLQAMKQMLQKQGEQIQELLKGRTEDQNKIQRLEQMIGETQKTAAQSQQAATNAQQKAEETQKTTAEVAAKVQTLQTAPSEEASAKRHVMVTGMADFIAQKVNGENGTFAQAHVAPILLFRASDKVLFETELEMKIQSDGSTDLNLEYAQLDYVLNDYMTLIAGRFVLPLGVVREKHDAVWINKLPLMPLPEADGTAIIPENDIGLQARGGFHLSDRALMTYAGYIGNGPGSGGDGPGHYDPSGVWEPTSNGFNGGSSVSGRPNGGGRLAVFYPWAANHDVEVGMSGQTGYGASDLMWSAFALDAALHFTPNLEFRGEFINTWEETADVGTLKRQGWWAQAAYKLAGLNLELPVINSLEAVFRYGGEQLPDGHINQFDLGLTYHVTNTLLVKGAYSFRNGTAYNADAGNNDWPNMLTFQVAYGF